MALCLADRALCAGKEVQQLGFHQIKSTDAAVSLPMPTVAAGAAVLVPSQQQHFMHAENLGKLGSESLAQSSLVEGCTTGPRCGSAQNQYKIEPENLAMHKKGCWEETNQEFGLEFKHPTSCRSPEGGQELQQAGTQGAELINSQQMDAFDELEAMVLAATQACNLQAPLPSTSQVRVSSILGKGGAICKALQARSESSTLDGHYMPSQSKPALPHIYTAVTQNTVTLSHLTIWCEGQPIIWPLRNIPK